MRSSSRGEHNYHDDSDDDDDETFGMETVTITSASVAANSVADSASVTANSVAKTAAARAEADVKAAATISEQPRPKQQMQQREESQGVMEGAMQNEPVASASAEVGRKQQQEQQGSGDHYHDVPPATHDHGPAAGHVQNRTAQSSGAASAAAATSGPQQQHATSTARMSALDQTAAARAERRRIFFQRTSQTARRVWDRINPNLQLCLCQTAAKQLEAESTYQYSDRSWIQSPSGAAAASYAQTAADSIGRDFEVEVYRRFLFADDDRTYSKCEDVGAEADNEDVDVEAEGDGREDGNKEVAEKDTCSGRGWDGVEAAAAAAEGGDGSVDTEEVHQ